MSQKFYQLTEKNITDYIKQVLNIFPPGNEFTVTEIGDGNINYVFRVIDQVEGKSYILKQSHDLLRSSGRPLSTLRSRIEVEALKLQDQLSPGFVPKVLTYDEVMKVIVMEDLTDYENLRYALLEGRIFPQLAEHMSSFMAETSLPTTDLIMDRQEKKELVGRFINPEMCDITEDLVLSEPYTDYKKRNVITPGNEEFVHQQIYGDRALTFEAGKLRHSFMNHPQALLHGDLHTGSIFVKVNATKVIDPEFAFYGPIGYDLGTFLANLIFAWGNGTVIKAIGEDFLPWIEETIEETIDLFRKKSETIYRQSVMEPMSKNEAYMNWYMEQVLADTAGFAGMELIRRIIGDAKVIDITAIHDRLLRLKIEQKLLRLGKKLILERDYIKEGKNYRRFLSDIIIQ